MTFEVGTKGETERDEAKLKFNTIYIVYAVHVNLHICVSMFAKWNMFAHKLAKCMWIRLLLFSFCLWIGLCVLLCGIPWNLSKNSSFILLNCSQIFLFIQILNVTCIFYPIFLFIFFVSQIVSLTELMAGVKAPTKTVQLFQLTCFPLGHKVCTCTIILSTSLFRSLTHQHSICQWSDTSLCRNVSSLFFHILNNFVVKIAFPSTVK